MTTTTTTTRDFVRRLRRSELMDIDSLRKSLAAIQTKHNGQLPEDAKVIAEDLVGGGSITQWQAKNLLQGRWRGFFLGKYKLLRQLGSGGMSTVFLAEHTVMRRRVAIKVLPRHRLQNPVNLSRFHQEARTCAMLNHPNVVQAIDFDSVDEQHYMVMEFIDGMDLQRLVRQNGPLPIERAIDYLRCCASGLQHAHERGIIHRDIKPLNILINRDGVLKLSDLGLARLRYDEDPALTGESKGVLGTADYLAPEQARSSQLADGRSDLYSLGCTLFFMLTGVAPFGSGTIQQRIAKHQTSPPPDVRRLRPECPPELAEICMRLMAKSPEDRFQTATLLIQAIDRVTWKVGASPSTLGINEALQHEELSLADDTPSDRSSESLSAQPVVRGSASPIDDFALSSSVDDGSDSSLDDLLSGIELPSIGNSASPNFQSTAYPSQDFAGQSFQTVPQQVGASFPPSGSFHSPAANKGNRGKPSASENKAVIYAGIGMAVFAVLLSVIMSVVFVLSPDDKTRNMIKNTEPGKSNVLIIPQ
ncbi:MAG: serine/threonine-protein kinase [Pirellulaceae bacterium]